MKSISARHLSYSYSSGPGKKDDSGLKVLENISFTIVPGRFLVILGKSGCGKTTLLNLIAGLLEPREHQLLIDEKPITGPDPSRSYIFQTPRLLPWLNVKDNIAFGCRVRGDTYNLRNRISEHIELIGLCDFETSYPANLSAGMAQRVAIARALIGRPDILLLDEPFTALDYYNRSRLQNELIRLWNQFRFTAVFVTHDIDEALTLGQRIIILGSQPSTIIRSYDLDSAAPRDLTDGSFFELKTEIQKALSQEQTGPNRGENV